MLNNSPVSGRIFGFLVICLGGALAYPALGKLYGYVHTGYIVFDPRGSAPVYGSEAAFWHAAYMLLGLWAAAYGISLVLRK